jgi:hypothetical protein
VSVISLGAFVGDRVGFGLGIFSPDTLEGTWGIPGSWRCVRHCNWRTLPGQFWPFCRLASHDSRRISRTWGGRDSAAGSGETSDSGVPFFVGPLDNDQEVADRPQFENLPLVFWDLDQDQGERLFGPGGNPGHLDCCCDGRGVFTVLRARVRLVCYLVDCDERGPFVVGI